MIHEEREARAQQYLAGVPCVDCGQQFTRKTVRPSDGRAVCVYRRGCRPLGRPVFGDARWLRELGLDR